MLTRRHLLVVGLAATGGSLLAACGGAPAASPGSAPTTAASTVASAGQSSPKTGATFNIGHDADVLLGGDTMKATLSESTAVTSSMNGVGNLVKYKRENIYEIAPGVAESWESNTDKTQWTFKIRDNIKWHDGTPFTAQDAKWWLDLAVFGTKVGDKVRAPAVWAGSLGKIASTDAVDQNHLQVTLAAPSPQFLTLLGSPINQIGHPRHLMQPLIDQGNVDVSPQDINYVSIGPFKMVSYDKGTRVQVKRNDQYWETDAQGRQLPYLDGIQWAILPDPSAMDYAFFNGQLDMGSRAASHILTKDRKDQYVQTLGDKVNFTSMTFTSTALVMNSLTSGPFQDVRVRQAVSRWIDRDAFSPAAGGLTFLQPIMNAQNPYTSPDFMTWPGFNTATRQQDMAQAKQLMADAGYAGGFETSLVGWNTAQNTAVFEQGQLAGLNIKADLKMVDNPGWVQTGYSRNYEMYSGATPLGLVPEQLEDHLNSASLTPTGGQSSAFEDPKVPPMWDALHAATTMDARIQAWRAIEKYLIVDQAYFAVLPGRLWVVPYRTYVQGLFPPPENQYHNLDFASVWLDK